VPIRSASADPWRQCETGKPLACLRLVRRSVTLSFMSDADRTTEADTKNAYPIPTKRNLWIALTQILCAFGIFYLTSKSDHWWQLFALAALFAVLGNSIYSIIHEAEHGILHPDRRWNDAIGVTMALFFPAPFHLIRQGHIGHHRRNRSDDEAFDFYFEGDRRWLKWIILYGILTGFYWLLVVASNVLVVIFPGVLHRRFFEFDQPSVAFMDSLNPKYLGVIRLEGLAACIFHVLIVWALAIPILTYAIVYFGFGFSWSAMQYVHHFGTERHVLRGTRNLWLLAPIDLIWLHHNWHLSHHRHPTVPWIYLPELSALEDGSEREFLIWHYFRMWRGPRRTNQHVENKFGGKIVE
jgi:fatty acid desaturase